MEQTLHYRLRSLNSILFYFIFLYCSGFCHTLTWISHGFTCVPHPDPPSHLPLHPIPLGLPSAPGPSTCLMHPTWAGDLFLNSILYMMFLCFLSVLILTCSIKIFVAAWGIFSRGIWALIWGLVPWPEMESLPPALEGWSLNHQTIRWVPTYDVSIWHSFMKLSQFGT